LDSLVDVSNFASIKVLDVTVFSLDNTVGVDVGLLDGDDSLSAMAFLEAVSFVLFSASMEAFDVTSEFLGNLSGGSSEILSHLFLSSFVLFMGNLKFFSSSLEKSRVSTLKVINIGVVFVGKSFFSWCWELIVMCGTSGFTFNAGFHSLVGLGVPVSIKDIGVDAFSGDFFVARTVNGKLLEENDVILSDWFVVFSEDNVLSNFV
jgi:hypothetical protein